MKFILESDGTLKYMTSLNNEDVNNLVVEHNVLIYDYIINDNNSIYLVYLQNNGSLSYKYINNEEITEFLIGKFDVKSNIYNGISILNINKKLNLIYSFYNIMNPNVHTIHHIILSNNSQEKNSVIKFVSKSQGYHFVVDNDSKNNIHLFYNTISKNFSYIYYIYFNPYKNQWLTNPMRLSSSDSHSESPSIFVDHMDNIHGTWWEKTSNGYILKYKKLSPSGSEMYKWKAMIIPSIIQDKASSKIYGINNNIYIECLDYVLISNDFGMNWIKDEKEIGKNLIVENVSDIITEDSINNEDSYEFPADDDFTDESSKLKYEILLLNQEEILINLKDLLYKQEILKSKIFDIEDSFKKQNKSILKRIFFD